MVTLVRLGLRMCTFQYGMLKMECNFTNGPKHFFFILRYTQKLFKKIRIKVLHKILQTKAFYDYFQNILISMIHDREQCIRKFGWRRIFLNQKWQLVITLVSGSRRYWH